MLHFSLILAMILSACSSGSDLSGSSGRTEKTKAKADPEEPEEPEDDPPDAKKATKPAAKDDPALESDSGTTSSVTCKATVGTVSLVGDKTQIAVTVTGDATAIYVNGESHALDPEGKAAIDVTATAAAQSFAISADGKKTLCSVELAAALNSCKLELDVTPVQGSCGGNQQSCYQTTCEYQGHAGTAHFSLPDGAKNFKVTLTSLYADDHGGVVSLNGHALADYSSEGNQQAGMMLAHTVSPNVDASAFFVAGQNSVDGSVYNIECPDYKVSAHFSGTYQAPSCQ